jgi:glycosyltransferase involved in cell wall biosynthesis
MQGDEIFHKRKPALWDIAMVVSRFGSVDPLKSNNGVLVANYFLAQEFAKLGKKVCLLIQSINNSDIQLNGIQLFHIGGSSDEALAGCLQRMGGCDILIENSNATACRSKICNALIVIMHNRHHLWGAEQYGRSIYELPSAVVCVSRFSLKENLGWGVPPRLLKCIPNGCNFNVFYPRDVIRNSQRLIFAGYTSNRKGIHKAIEAFRKIKKDFFPELEMVVCGKQAPWSDSPECDLWQARGWLDKNKVIDWEKVQCACPGLNYIGEISADELAMEFSKSSLLILPSNMDTFGLVCVEAQACGCIPIVPKNSCLEETLEPYIRHHFSYDTKDDKNLYQCIIKHLKNRYIGNYRSACMQYVKDNFSWYKSAKSYLTLMDSTPKKMSIRIASFQIKFWVSKIIKNLIGIKKAHTQFQNTKKIN